MGFLWTFKIFITRRKTVTESSLTIAPYGKILSDRGQIMTAVAYATERNDESQRKFQTALRHIGFSVKLKPYIQRADGSAKGDWDVGITIDMLQSVADLDRMFLLSGDGDFDLLIRTLKNDYGSSGRSIWCSRFNSGFAAARRLELSFNHRVAVDLAAPFIVSYCDFKCNL